MFNTVFCLGDIYYQCITHDTELNKYSPINCKSYFILNAWENAICSQTNTITPLTMSDKSNMQHIYNSKYLLTLKMVYNT